ncbi:MAG: hypothetical protein ABIN74_02660, partial [Ferruginibacter sp.]
MKLFLLLSITVLLSHFSTAQSFAINTDGSAASNSAMLDIKSTTKGILIPRLTTAQRNAIASPANGLMVFDVTTGSFWYFNFTWIECVNSFNNLWVKDNSNNIYNINSGNVGIGINNPTALLEVVNGSVLFVGDVSIPPTTTIPPPIEGASARMMWYSPRAAFRAGHVDGTQWDKDSIGRYSFAAGHNNKAKGESSFAAGDNNNALGSFSTALGTNANALQSGSTSIGSQ